MKRAVIIKFLIFSLFEIVGQIAKIKKATFGERARESAYAGAMKAVEPARLAMSGFGVGPRCARRGGLKCIWVNSVNARVGGSTVGNRGHDVAG